MSKKKNIKNFDSENRMQTKAIRKFSTISS